MIIALLPCFIGLCIGSFLNVLIDRIPRGESFLKGRSHCDFCLHQLRWYDLIPLLSFFLLKGRCRYCSKKIGWQYPIVELTTAILFILTFQFSRQQSPVEIAFAFYVISVSIIIFYTDLWFGIIPDSILLISSCITILFFLFEKEQFLSHIIGFFFAGGLFAFLYLITKKKGMGFGDVKFAAFLGLLFGIPLIILTLYVAFLTGSILALILVVVRRKRFHNDTIPFGPFLAFGMVVVFFWGQSIWQLFTRLIFGW
ncbi:MAG TPA: prepilin peptidase [Patescibacteria group bacterium]|nr:prepilin peptidase [Patescibacteria group bacterium]